MIVKLIHKPRGSDVETRVFTGPEMGKLQLTGQLVLHPDEITALMRLLAGKEPIKVLAHKSWGLSGEATLEIGEEQ